MYLNLRDLEENPVTLHGTLNMDDAVTGRNDLRLKGPVDVRLEARMDSGTAIVYGTLTADMEIICSRCLHKADRQLEIPVTEMFTTRPGNAELDEDIHLVTEDKIELQPYLREALVVQLPIAAICKDDCEGLCPTCGANRNEETCECVQERIDPRLAGLKDFFKHSN